MADITALPSTLISSILVHAITTTPTTSVSSYEPIFLTFPTPTIPAESAIRQYTWAHYMWPIIIGAIFGVIVAGCIIYFLWRAILSCLYYFLRGIACVLDTFLDGTWWIGTKLRDKKNQCIGWRQKRRRTIAERREGLRRAREQREAVRLEIMERKRREKELRAAAELERKRGVVSIEAIDIA